MLRDSAKAPTVRSLSIWAASAIFIVVYNIASGAYPTLNSPLYTNLFVFAAAGMIYASLRNMKTVPSREVFVSRLNTASQNLINLMNMVIGIMSAVCFFGLLNVFGQVLPFSVIFFLLLCGMFASPVFQCFLMMRQKREY